MLATGDHGLVTVTSGRPRLEVGLVVAKHRPSWRQVLNVPFINRLGCKVVDRINDGAYRIASMIDRNRCGDVNLVD